MVLPAELNDLEFEAEGKLEVALDAAFIKLQELAYDLKQSDPAHDRALRAELQGCLDRIVKAIP